MGRGRAKVASDSTLHAKKKFVVERRPLGSLPLLLPGRKYSLKTGTLNVQGKGVLPRPTPQRVFEYLLHYCNQGVRAPTRDEVTADLGHMTSPIVTLLALDGLITIEIFGRNWRVFEINGKRTAEDPSGGAPQRRFSKAGPERWVNGKWIPAPSIASFLRDRGVEP